MRKMLPLFSALLLFAWQGVAAEVPDTGISGVYEVMVGVDDAEQALAYFSEFGFAPVASAETDSRAGGTVVRRQVGAAILAAAERHRGRPRPVAASAMGKALGTRGWVRGPRRRSAPEWR